MDEKFWVKKFWVKKIKIFGVQNNFGHKNEGPKKIGSKSLVKIRSVTTEIFMIWTNVARTYITWKNVTVTVGIY